MRFTIRDLLWLTLVVALGVGWWLSDRWWAGQCDDIRAAYAADALAADSENDELIVRVRELEREVEESRVFMMRDPLD